MIRVLCVLLVINTFPGGSQTSEAAGQSIQYNQTNNGLAGQLGTHDFQYAYANFNDGSLTNGLLLIGGSSTSSVKLMSAFAKYSIPASGFPSSGQKAVLSLKIDSSSDTSDATYPPILQVWQYTGSTNYSPIRDQTDPSLWPQTRASLRSNPDFTLLDTKNATAIANAISNGTNLTFDVDAAVKGKAGTVVQFLITGPESSSKPSTDNRFEVTSQAPFLTEVAGGPPAAANTSTVTASPTTVTANGTASSTITITVKDASNNLLSGKTVTLTKGSSNSVISPSSQVTNASGVATFAVTNTKAEQSTYTASVAADAVTITQTASVTFQPGPVSAGQSTVTASPTTLTANNTSSSTITVTLKDANNNLITGQDVTLSQGSGSSTISPTLSTTNASGVATFTVRNTKAEAVTYTASANGVSLTSTPTVTFQAGAVNASTSAITASKANVIANNTDNATITVTLRDINNNPVGSQAVTIAQGSGSSTITATQGTTNASGVATFTVKSTKAETVTYSASAGGTTTASTASVTFQPGAVSAAQSTVSVSKNSVFADGSDSSTVTVTLNDINGNTVSGKSVTLSQGSGSSTINPSTAVTTNASGQAIFTVTSVKAETVTYTATDATDSLTVTQTGAVTFVPGAVDAAASTVVASKANVIANNVDSATITVTLRDAGNNAISNRSVTLSQGIGSSTITTTPGTTDANGVATFTVKSTKAEGITYTATAGGVTVTATAGVTFQPGAVSAAQSKVEASKANVSADNVDTSIIMVTLTDSNGNPIGGKSITLAQGSGGSTISPSTAVMTNASGQVAFTVKSTKAETVIYTATDATDSITLTQTASVTFDPGAVDANLSTITTSKANVAADNTDTATITVHLKDSSGNAISGKNVTLSQGSGSSAITATQGTTDASGVATFTVKSTKAETVTYTAVSSSVTLSLHPVPVTFTPGAADGTTSQITTSKASVSANGSDFSTISVTVKDIHGNVIAGRNVTLQQGIGSSLISPAQATTNVDGVASFNVTNTKTENVVYIANVINENVTISQTANVNFLSANAYLNGLDISSGTLIPVFLPMEINYVANVTDDVYQITFTPTAADSHATIRINGTAVQSGLASTPISLVTGSNTITIEVLAADGKTRQRYTIVVMREPNKDARLKALSGLPKALTPAFDSAVTKYTVHVANHVEQYEVQAELQNELSNLTVTGAVYDSSINAYVTNLQVGTNTIQLNVTAQDGVTEANYIIEVIRTSVQDEVRRALNNLTIGYTGDDTWEFVTRDLLLTNTQDDLPVVWNTSKPDIVESNGTVTRPASQESAVILTASIEYLNVKMSRTFLIVVKPQGLSVVSSGVTRNVPIRIGTSNTDVEQTPITRKELSDGNKIDKVIATTSQLSNALQSAVTNNESNVRVVATDIPTDPADEVTIDVPASSYDPLAGVVDLTLETDYAHIMLDKSTLSQLNTAGQSLFFRFVPIRQASQITQVKEQALADPLVKQAASTGTASQIGTPMTIETNYSSYNTTLLFPASKLNLPTGSVSQQAAYAADLYVYIQHSDGEIALQRGTVQYDANGQIEGIAITINKFSTFTILHVQPANSSSGGGSGSDGGNAGGGSTSPASTPTPGTKPSTPEETPTPAQPGASGEHASYIQGYPDGTFRPSQTTTRTELASMLWRVMLENGSQPDPSVSGSYSDVAQSHWAYEAIRQLHSKQIMLGITTDQFVPNRALTRAEFAVLAVRWQQLTTDGSGETSFTDITNHWAAPSIAVLVQKGIVKGYTDGTFRPNDGVTRAELVTMMNRLLKRGPLTGVTTPTWKDVSSTHWAFADIEEASQSHHYNVLPSGAEQWINN